MVGKVDKNLALHLLDLPPSFTEDELKQAWRASAKKYHPDITGDEKNFIEIKKAYDFLVKYRKKYPKETDWEELFKNHKPMQEQSSNYYNDNINFDGEGGLIENNFIFISLLLIIITVMYILIQSTSNNFIRGLWYSLSATFVNPNVTTLTFKGLLRFFTTKSLIP